MNKLIVTINKSLPTFSFTRRVHVEVKKKLAEKKSAKKLALDYFDFFYGSTYGIEWNRMRVAMLTGSNKPTALLNTYAYEIVNTEQKLIGLTAIDMFKFSRENYCNYLREAGKDETKVDFLKIPGLFKAFCFDLDNLSKFPSPKPDPINHLLS